jgi:predicted nucleic acid-binding protein
MTISAVYDANVLYPSTLRDLLIRVVQAQLVRARWSEQILAEMNAALRKQRPDVDVEKLSRLCELMIKAVRDCLVEDYTSLADGVDLPDPDDRHVVAAAIKCHAEVIVTFNLKDFPNKELGRWGVKAVSPDEFMLDLIDLNPRVVWSCVQQTADSHRRPPQSFDDVLGQLERCGLLGTAAALRVS